MTHIPYPAMSHPTADPAVNAATAMLAGHRPADPARARVLEVGCASGHHLLPLAMRWPQACLTGIDTDARAIRDARELAAEAGLANIAFHECSLADFQPRDGGSYDFIIAHGVFSWVPDAAKSALMRLIARCLSGDGLAIVSFNVAAGWRARLPLVAAARQLMETRDLDVMAALHHLHGASSDRAEKAILADMIAKGPAVLAHDDFAPVNDPWSLADVVALAARHNLQWLGEGVPADNLPQPRELAADPRLDACAGDTLATHQALDDLGLRTFRSAMFRRADAPPIGRVSAAVVGHFHLSATSPPPEDDPAALALDRELQRAAPGDLSGTFLIERFGPPAATSVMRGIAAGWIAARTHPVQAAREVPDPPCPDPLRAACARRGLPVVDERHRPCSFPPAHAALLAKIDGTLTHAGIRAIAARDCPKLAINPWLHHLAGRGLFAPRPATIRETTISHG